MIVNRYLCEVDVAFRSMRETSDSNCAQCHNGIQKTCVLFQSLKTLIKYFLRLETFDRHFSKKYFDLQYAMQMYSTMWWCMFDSIIQLFSSILLCVCPSIEREFVCLPRFEVWPNKKVNQTKSRLHVATRLWKPNAWMNVLLRDNAIFQFPSLLWKWMFRWTLKLDLWERASSRHFGSFLFPIIELYQIH